MSRYGQNLVNLLSSRGCTTVSSGPNVAHGHVNIACPFCTDDPSAHMGINLETGAWGCWRDPAHRGYKPHRLLKASLGMGARAVSDWLASQAVTNRHALPTQSFLVPPDRTRTERVVSIFGQFKTWEDLQSRGKVNPFRQYLQSRGLTDEEVVTLSGQYGLRYAFYGRYAWRVIFTIGHYAWTARTINETVLPRYLAGQVFEGASSRITDCVWGEDRLRHESFETLVVTEGPFDALRVSLQGKPYGIVATAIFGSAVSPAQRQTLQLLMRRARDVVYCLDSDNFNGTIRGAVMGRARTAFLPGHVKDAASASRSELDAWCRGLQQA